ncbi:MAG: hypothetical protein LBL79_08470 [Prevotella sp.]|nr:hypothetical protein [Prevotella sp.]
MKQMFDYFRFKKGQERRLREKLLFYAGSKCSQNEIQELVEFILYNKQTKAHLLSEYERQCMEEVYQLYKDRK